MFESLPMFDLDCRDEAPVVDRDDIRRMVRAVANFYELREQWILGPLRAGDYSWARHVVMAIAYASGFSLLTIGAELNRDHSTVIHGRNVVKNEIYRFTEHGKEAVYLMNDWREWA
jgi:chromosomal replication initiation ATPase DnaA